MLNKLKITLLLAISLTLILITSPAQASHCMGLTEALNKFSGANPGSDIIADYESMDALTYLGFMNNLPNGTPFITGDAILVGNHPAYEHVIVLVFHEGCYAGFRRVPTPVHYQWDEMIKGPEA